MKHLGLKSLGGEKSWGWKVLGVKGLGGEKSWGWKVLGVKKLGLKSHGGEKSWGWKVLGVKSLGGEKSWGWKVLGVKGLGGETSRGEKSRGEKAGVNRHVAEKRWISFWMTINFLRYLIENLIFLHYFWNKNFSQSYLPTMMNAFGKESETKVPRKLFKVKITFTCLHQTLFPIQVIYQ